MRQAFAEKLQACGSSKEKLQALMASLDEEKRSLKSRLSRLSSEPEGRYSMGRERQVQIRAINQRNVKFCHAFVAAAERVLSKDDLLVIEMKASEMLTAGS